MKRNIIPRTILTLTSVLSLLLISPVAFAGTETATRIYDSRNLTIRTVNVHDTQYSRIDIFGLINGCREGAPELPFEIIRFIVPALSNDFRASVVSVGASETRTLPYRLLPIQKPTPTNGLVEHDFIIPDEVAYSEHNNIRAEVLEDVFIDGNNHIVSVAVYPLSYDDHSRQICMAKSITVSLTYSSCDISAMGTQPIFPPRTSGFFNIDDIVVNKSSTEKFASKRISSDTIPQYYYIITPKTLKDSFRHLVTWKAQKGYKVVLKCIEEVYSDPRYKIGTSHTFTNNTIEEIVDSAASLRAYLKDEYLDKGSYFCLLAGDYRTSTPIRYTHTTYYNNTREYATNIHGSAYTPTDCYFSDFTFKWELKPHLGQLYANESYISSYSPAIAIGRLLCSKPIEVENYIHKLIVYESNPGVGNPSYLKNILYFEQDKTEKGVTIRPDKNDTLNVIRKEDSSLLGQSAKLRRVFDPFPETTKVIADSCFFYYAYKTDDDSLDYHKFTPHMGKDIIAEISKVGFSSWHGHGSPTQVGTCDWQYFISPLSEYDNSQLTQIKKDWDKDNGLSSLNNSSRPSIVYAISCDIAPFDCFQAVDEIKDEKDRIIDEKNGHIYNVPYNFAAAFTVAGQYGGPAILANARHGFVSSSLNLETEFLKLLPLNPKLGIAETLSKTNCYDSHLRATHHLIGDPEFEMWLNLPKKFDNLSFSNNGLAISANDLDGSRITLYRGNNLFSMHESNSNSITLHTGILKGDYSVSIWKNGYLPITNMYASEGSLIGSRKEYIVNKAIIGSIFSAEPGSPFDKKYIVGKDGILEVYANENITAYGSFIIDDGATVILDCSKSIHLSCVVKKGGKLTVRGKSIKLGADFKVEKGAVFISETK